MINFACFDSEDSEEVFNFLKESSEKMSVIFHNYIIAYKKLIIKIRFNKFKIAFVSLVNW